MESQRHQKAPASLLPGVLDHLGLAQTSSMPEVSPESLPAMLKDADWRVRTKAISELAEFTTSTPLDTLLTALHDEDASVRAACVHALGRKGSLAVPYIIDALHDSEWLVREAAVLVLGELGEQSSAEQLLASLGDKNEFVREAANMALEQNRVFRSDNAENEDANENVIITDLDPSARANHLRRFAAFRRQSRRLATIGFQQAASARLQPRRLAAVALTGLVVVVLLVAWLALIPVLRSSRSAHSNPPQTATVLFSSHYQGGAYLPQWAPDGRHMAFVDEIGTMYVWDARTKTLNATFTLPYLPKPDTMAVWGWTSDGQHIVSFDYTTGAIQPGPFGSGTTIYLWDALTGKRVVSLATQSNIWADDGNRIAIIDQRNVIHVFIMDTGQELYTISSEHFKQLSDISWSPDRQRIATSSLDGTVEIWNATTGKRLQSFSDPGIAPQDVHNITFLFTTWAPDGKRLLTQRIESNGTYKSLQIWDASTGQKLQTFSAHTSTPFTASWFSDGKRILSSSDNETLIWEAATGRVLASIPNNHTQYPGTPVLSPDEHWLAFSDGTQTIQIWNTSTGRQVFTYRGHSADVVTTSIAWSPDSASISSADTDGNILVWQARTGKLILSYKLNFSLPSNYIPTHLAFLVWSRDGTMLAVASDEGTIAVLQAS